MKLVRGRTLRPDGESPTEMLRIFLRICEPVAFAHVRGFVHRDLKPENIMIGPFGEVLVMDWGVATMLDGDREHVVAGTNGFMAPEQERGDIADKRADVFALGRILELIIETPPKPLRSIVAKATALSPADRYAHAGELAEDVARFLDGVRVTAHRENPIERAMRWLNRHRALVGMILAYLIMRTIVFFYARA